MSAFIVFKHHLFKIVLAVLCMDDLAFAVLNCFVFLIIQYIFSLTFIVYFIYFAWGFNLYTSCVLGLHPFALFVQLL